MRQLDGRAAALTFAGLILTGAVAHAAGELDPDLPHAVFVGRPPAAVPAVPAYSPAQAPQPTLPANPARAWQRELEVGVEVPPAVASDGGVVVALSSAEVLRLGPDGKELWRRSLGSAAATSAPVITSDGGVVVLTGEGGMWRLTAGGDVSSRRQLAWDEANDVVPPLVRDDGSIVLAGASSAMVVDGQGRVTARTRLTAIPTGHLLSWQGGVVWASRRGVVTHWRPPRRPERLGLLGGNIFEGGPILASDRTLVGVVDGSTVVAFDLLGRRATPLYDVLGQAQLDGTPAMSGGETLLFTTMAGLMVGLDPKGLEVRRLALDPAAAIPMAVAPGTVPVVRRRFDVDPSPPLLVDSAGRVAFLRADGRMGVVMPGGEPRTINSSLCARPVAFLPAGKGRIVVACRLGEIIMLEDAKTPEAETEPESAPNPVPKAPPGEAPGDTP